MKTRTFIFLFVISSLLTFARDIPKYLPEKGLVVWYPFNGNANDYSGHKINGTVSGATLTTDRFGNANSAYSFNGINDYIELPNSSRFDNRTFSISFWVKTVEKTEYPNPSIMSRVDGAGHFADTWAIYEIGGACHLSTMCSAPQGCAGAQTITTIADYKWHHVAFTVSRNQCTCYKDGVKTETVKYETPVNEHPYVTRIGKSLNNYWKGFRGSVDDIAIYNRALSESEVRALFNPAPSSPEIIVAAPAVTSGLVAWYPFSGNAIDGSMHGNNGLVSGAVLTEDRFGNPNSAYKFNGSSMIQLVMPAHDAPAESRYYSTSFWFKKTGSATASRMVWQYMDGTTENRSNYDFYSDHTLCSAGVPAAQNYPFYNPSACGPDVISPDQWTHIYMVFDQEAHTFSVYNNGVYSFSGPIGNRRPSSGYLTFGNNAKGTNGFTGSIDDIAIWNRALSPGEIQGLYEATPRFFDHYLPGEPPDGEHPRIHMYPKIDANYTNVSMFYGIIIRIGNISDAFNTPIVNVVYQKENATININNGSVIDGALSPKQLKLVTAWIEIHKDELLADWELCRNREKPFAIEPLK